MWIEPFKFLVYWIVVSGFSAMTRMCLWCGKEMKDPSLPSLHKECVPPDFGFPVGFESGKTRFAKFIEIKRPMHSPSITVCYVQYVMYVNINNINIVDHSNLKTLWVLGNGVNVHWALNIESPLIFAFTHKSKSTELLHICAVQLQYIILITAWYGSLQTYCQSSPVPAA